MFVFLLLNSILIKASYWPGNILLLIGFFLFLMLTQIHRISYTGFKRNRLESLSFSNLYFLPSLLHETCHKPMDDGHGMIQFVGWNHWLKEAGIT